MKKFISILLALMLVMSLGTVAFADNNSAAFDKIYASENGTAVPDETFKLELVSSTCDNSDVTDVPALILGQASFTEVGTKSFGVVLPEYTKVGVYTYVLKENTSANTAGMTYFTDDIILTVLVTNGENGALDVSYGFKANTADTAKISNITNTYSAAGTEDGNDGLIVSKKVTGNLGDKNKPFHFTVEFEKVADADYTNINSKYTVAGGNPVAIDWNKPTVEFDLKDGDSCRFINIPYNVKYTVTENDYSGLGYTTTVNDVDTLTASGTVSTASIPVNYVNDKNDENIETGISLDSLPYILMLVVVGAAIVVVSTRKKGEQF